MNIHYSFNRLAELSLKHVAGTLISKETSLKLVNYLAILTLYLALALPGKLQAQCANYEVYESFKNAVPDSGGGWQLLGTMGLTINHNATAFPRTGAYHMAFSAINTAIRTPLITNPGIFSFWSARTTTVASHTFTVETSPDGLAPWTFRFLTPETTVAYTPHTVDLGGLTNVYIRIRDTRGSGGAVRYIDDISWTSATTGNTLIPALSNCAQTIDCGTSYNFTDAGGTSDTYNLNSDYTITFTPSVGTSKVQMVFNTFNTQNGNDGMVIYDGPTAASPIIPSGLPAGANATNCPADSFYGTTSPGTVTSSGASGAITIRFRSDATLNSTNPGWAASVNCYTIAACTATAQPTALVFGATTTSSIAGSFTAAVPAPNKYLVVRSTSAIAPTPGPVNTNVYAVGNVIDGATVVSINNSTSFTATGLNPGTQYYFYIYSYNDSPCTGGPVYNTVSPLTNNSTTITPPINYLCSTATALPCATTNLTGTTINSANTPHGTTCTIGNYGVWYTFTGDGTISNITSTASGWNHEMTILSGSCGSFTNIACQDANGVGGTESYSFLATSGVNYFIYIADTVAGGTSTGTFTISRTCTTPPTNGLCSTASALPCATSNLAGTTVSTTNIAHGTSCTMGNYGVWYTFIGDGLQSVISSVAAGWDHEMSISSGSCGSFTNVACRDSAGVGGAETFTFTTTAGVNYYVYISSNTSGSTATGSFTISRTCSTPPANNVCLAATSLACATSNLSGTTVGAPSAIHGTGCTMGNYGAWYTFTGNGNLTTISCTATSGWDQEMSISSGACGTLTNITCQDVGFSNGTESYTFPTVFGVNYYVYISHYDSTSTITGTFIISRTCAAPPPPLTNDECVNAISLTVNPTCTFTTYTNAGATSSTGITAPGCAGYSGGDVWFSAVVPANGILYVDTEQGVITDGGMAFYTGSCGSLTLLECDDDDSTNGAMPFIAKVGLTPGITVFIRMWEFGNNNNGTFGICATSPVSCSSGPGTGTTTLACPEAFSGGLGLSGADPAPVNACVTSTCANLEATYVPMAQTTSYTVTSIPFPPPYQFGCLQNPVSVNTDDVWSPTVVLPFNFCFYGNNYNQCLIGSNGVLTFDLVNNIAEGPSAWSFSNTLPSATLFPNTIFGAYHDIDPSKGGEVGWELITLTSGCRALVVSWNNIPMFSTACNALLYTGMMVLYENTNVIEVYIKEKNICASWNGGNALIGVQNAAASAAAFPPSRNTVATDWSATNEGWRFTPSGPAITPTFIWYNDYTGAVVGNTATINVCPAATTTYTAEVTFPLCSGPHTEIDQTTVTVLGSKTWNGSVSTDWSVANNWTPTGIPNGADCVVIPITSRNPIISGAGTNGLAGTLTVLNGATLTVNSATSVTVTDWVNVGTTGTFTVQDNGSLVQINNVANTGNIIYKRNAPNVKSLDYVYWSSPVANFNVSNIPAPLTPGPIYTWNPTIANPNGGQGNWNSASGNMQLAKGYIVRAPSTFTATPATLSGTFTGVPNNGTITAAILRGSDQNTAFHVGINGTQITNFSDNNNLLGNPYPSAIRGSEFLFNNNTKIEGNIKLWTHGAIPSVIASPFYNSFIYNYNANDYLTFNFTGTSCCPAAGADIFIGAGQGFVVQMKDGPAASDVVTFTNSLRNAAHSNGSFYRMANQHTGGSGLTTLERHRMWLDIIDANNQSDRTLIGYIEGATLDRDSFYDASGILSTSLSIYSIIGVEKFNIQGRALPFNPDDVVPLAIAAPANGNYKIGINAVDGLFENPMQNIYLEDRTLGIIHNLRLEPYSFEAAAGIDDSRFYLRYTDSALTVSNPNGANGITALIYEKQLLVQASHNIVSIQVFDVSGKLVTTFTPQKKDRQFGDDFAFATGVYFAKIKLENGLSYNKKLMNK